MRLFLFDEGDFPGSVRMCMCVIVMCKCNFEPLYRKSFMNIQLQKFVNGRNLARFPKIKEVFFLLHDKRPIKKGDIGKFHRGCDVCSWVITLIALFTVTFSHLHYNVFERGCEAISGDFEFLPEIASPPRSNTL